MKDYYKTLQVKPKATLKEIKKAYRKLAKKYHPDKTADKDAETLFEEVSLAYTVLSSPQHRNQFDAFRLAGTLSQGSFISQPMKIYTADCNKCCKSGTVAIECSICSGNGHWYEKVSYGKNTVDSKIVCTTCQKTGKIYHTCFQCLGTGKTKNFKQ